MISRVQTTALQQDTSSAPHLANVVQRACACGGPAGMTDNCASCNAKELAGTLVLRLPIEEASAKVRTGPPLDDEEDYALECWAGVLPLRLTPGTPVPDPRMPEGRPLPASVTGYART